MPGPHRRIGLNPLRKGRSRIATQLVDRRLVATFPNWGSPCAAQHTHEARRCCERLLDRLSPGEQDVVIFELVRKYAGDENDR